MTEPEENKLMFGGSPIKISNDLAAKKIKI